MRSRDRLAAELQRDPRPQGAPVCWLEQATVTAVTAGGAADGSALCTVTWRGETHEAAYLASYTPVVGHVVAVVVQPPSLLVLGRVIGTPPTT